MKNIQYWNYPIKPRGRVRGEAWITCGLGTHLMNDDCPYCKAKTREEKLQVIQTATKKETRQPKQLW